jgi:dihydroorotase
MKHYDILFLANHFVLVTTVEMAAPATEEQVELEALERMASEYGADFANILKECSRVSVTEAPQAKDIEDGTKS